MAMSLNGKKVAILVENGFEEAEFLDPRRALEKAGAKTTVVSPVTGKVRAWKTKDWGAEVDVDLALDGADAGAFDALLLPGGVMNPDRLRLNAKAIDFVRAFVSAGKPVAAICHGPWTLIDAGAVRGKQMTSWPSLRADLENAGAKWVDQEVCVDGGLVTSRKPADLPVFDAKMIEAFAGAAGA